MKKLLLFSVLSLEIYISFDFLLKNCVQKKLEVCFEDNKSFLFFILIKNIYNFIVIIIKVYIKTVFNSIYN